MDLESIRIILQVITNYSLLFIVPLMCIIIGKRIYSEKKNIGQLNIIRCLILIIFICYAYVMVCVFIYEITPIGNTAQGEFFSTSLDTRSFKSSYMVVLGLMVSLSITLVCYANKWETFYFSSIYFYGGMLIFYFITGFEEWLLPYIYITMSISIGFMIFTGLKLKDNGALGIAIFFILAIPILPLGDTIIAQVFGIAHAIFGLYFSLGYFKPFKLEGERSE